MRRIWKIAKTAEWSGWNPKWRARCCPFCGGPENYRKHDPHCEIFRALRELELLYPEVTRAEPLSPLEQKEAKELERLFLGGIQDETDRLEGDGAGMFWDNPK